MENMRKVFLENIGKCFLLPIVEKLKNWILSKAYFGCHLPVASPAKPNIIDFESSGCNVQYTDIGAAMAPRVTYFLNLLF